MRIVYCTLLLAILPSVWAQHLEGVYKPAGKPEVAWQITNHETLVWGGNPYIPVGVEVQPNASAIAAAKKAGINDVLIDLPASPTGWDEELAALEQSNMRYLIRISSLAPMATGIAVDPAAYRLTGLSNSTHVDFELPGATQAMIVIALKRDGSVISRTRKSVVDGHLITDLNLPPGLECVVLVYPTMTSLQQPDYWESLDAHRDLLLSTLRRYRPGPGLRGIVNPLGRTLNLPGRELRFVPTTPAFKEEFAAYLETRYRNVVSALRAWSLSETTFFSAGSDPSKDDAGNFSDLANLVPLWSGSRGISQFWDTKRDQLFACDNRHSAFWKDLSDMIAATSARRFQRMVASIRSSVDVPVVQDWSGWSAPYESSDPSVDGIGMRATGSSHSAIVSMAAGSTSSILRWTNPGWLPATDIDLGSDSLIGELPGVLDDLASLGAKAFFCRADSPAMLKAVALEAAKRPADSAAAQYSPQAVFFPENATNPATAQRLPGGKWWLPCPADGNRIDYGSGIFGYRISDSSGVKTAIWAQDKRKVLLKMLSTKTVKFATVDGSVPEVKITKQGIEAELNEFPLIISGTEELPVPNSAYQATVAEYLQLLHVADTRHQEVLEDQLAFNDGVAGFDRNPGGVFVLLRQHLHRLEAIEGNFTWIEAETAQDTNFSEIISSQDCSGGKALALHAALENAAGFYASYELESHSKDDQAVWVAARISPEQRGDVQFRLGSQTFSLQGDPIGLYGGGFGWYYLGVTRLLSPVERLRIVVAKAGTDLQVDTILLTPPSFKPNGISYPGVELTPVKAPTKRGRRGGGGNG